MDLIESGRLLAGSDDARIGLPRPDAGELIVSGAEFALHHLADVPRTGDLPAAALGSTPLAREDAIEEILSPDLLLDHGVRRLTKLVLFPVRFIYTAATGRLATNAGAVARYLEDEEAPSTTLVAAALDWRRAPPRDRVAAADLLRSEMVPLYLHYIDDHIERLASIGEVGLVNAFHEWRRRLVP